MKPENGRCREERIWLQVSVFMTVTTIVVGELLVNAHAAGGVVVPAGTAYQLERTPVYVVGTATAGDDLAQRTSCIVDYPDRSLHLNVRTRPNRWRSAEFGRVLADRTVSLVCDRSVAVSAGPLVRTYPVLTWWGLRLLFVVTLGIWLSGRALQWARRRRSRSRCGKEAGR